MLQMLPRVKFENCGPGAVTDVKCWLFLPSLCGDIAWCFCCRCVGERRGWRRFDDAAQSRPEFPLFPLQQHTELPGACVCVCVCACVRACVLACVREQVCPTFPSYNCHFDAASLGGHVRLKGTCSACVCTDKCCRLCFVYQSMCACVCVSACV